MNLTPEHPLNELCRYLETEKVQYLFVGGTAVGFYGYYRPSVLVNGEVAAKPDFDIWYNPDYGNYFRLLNVLSHLGQDMGRFKKEAAPDPRKSFFKLSFETFTLDCLPSIPGNASFTACYSRRKVFQGPSLQVSVLSLEDLLNTKRALGRPKDLEDVRELEKLLRHDYKRFF